MQNARSGQGLVFDNEIAYTGGNSARKPPRKAWRKRILIAYGLGKIRAPIRGLSGAGRRANHERKGRGPRALQAGSELGGR